MNAIGEIRAARRAIMDMVGSAPNTIVLDIWSQPRAWLNLARRERINWMARLIRQELAIARATRKVARRMK